MLRHRYGWALAFGCAIVFAFSAVASAGRLSYSSSTLRATFSRVDFTGGFGTIECQVTLEGSYHSRSMAKLSESLIGLATRAVVGTCERGSATILQETLPWHWTYESFRGTLPRIFGINLRLTAGRFRLREPFFGIQCIVIIDATEPILLIHTRDVGSGILTSLELGGEAETDCATPARIRGRSTNFTALNSIARITVTLI